VHNDSQWPNLRHLGEQLWGDEDLLEAVSFKKATESMGRGRVLLLYYYYCCYCYCYYIYTHTRFMFSRPIFRIYSGQEFHQKELLRQYVYRNTAIVTGEMLPWSRTASSPSAHHSVPKLS